MEAHIRPVRASDCERLAEIYAPSVHHSVTSFEMEAPNAEEMAKRVERITANYPWLVAEDQQGRVVGYVYASVWRERSAYSKTCEAAIYVDAEVARSGIGRGLMEALLPELQRRGFHQVIAGVALPNEGSQALLRSLGFEEVGTFREVGRKLERWISVQFWQLALGQPAG